jgi:hypothetical protein
MADGITTPVLNPELVSRYDGLYDVSLVTLQTHASRQQCPAFSSKCWLQLMTNHFTVLSLLFVFAPGNIHITNFI